MKKIKVYFVLVLLISSRVVWATDKPSNPLVSGGVKAQSNASDLLINDIATRPNIRTTMNVGGEVGAFVDFNVRPHFFVQLNLLGVAAQNDLHDGNQHAKMWSVGLEVPLFFLGRYGDEHKGYLSFGGGPYVTFNLWGHLSGASPVTNPYFLTYTNVDGKQSAALRKFHSGLGVFLGYELPCGLQFNTSYQVALSDMLAYDHKQSSYLLPQKVTLGVGYRFNRINKTKKQEAMGFMSFFKRAFSDMKADMQAQHELDKANFNAVKAESKAQWEEAKRTPQQVREARNAERQMQMADAYWREAQAKERIVDAKQ